MSAPEPLPFIYTLDIGDVSGDGHGRSECWYFRTTHRDDNIRMAYERACENSNVALHEGQRIQKKSQAERQRYKKLAPKGRIVLFSGYQDSKVTPEAAKRLESIGVTVAPLADSKETKAGNTSYWLNGKGVAKLFLAMAASELVGFGHQFIECASINDWHYGQMGYGVYS